MTLNVYRIKNIASHEDVQTSIDEGNVADYVEAIHDFLREYEDLGCREENVVQIIDTGDHYDVVVKPDDEEHQAQIEDLMAEAGPEGDIALHQE